MLRKRKETPEEEGSFHRQPKRRRTKRETKKKKNGKQVYVEWVERGSDCSHHHAGGELETLQIANLVSMQFNETKQRHITVIIMRNEELTTAM
jgi:hypothetical protein